MESVGFSITGGGSSTAGELFLRVEQEDIPEYEKNPSPEDLVAMFNRTITGTSASTYYSPDCPIVITNESITVTLDFLVYVSDLEMQYSLFSTLIGEISPMSIRSNDEAFEKVVDMTDSIELGYLAENIRVQWETGAYNERGERINTPSYEIVGTKIVFSEEFFGVLWITATSKVHKYSIAITSYYADATNEINTKKNDESTTTGPSTTTESEDPELDTAPDEELPEAPEFDTPVVEEKPEPDKKYGELPTENSTAGWFYVDFTTTITATYTKSDGTEVQSSAELTPPGCVEGLMGVCLNGVLGDPGDAVVISPIKKYAVYYDSCDGRFLWAERQGTSNG